MRARFFAARTDLSWARMLLERQADGDVEKARRLLTTAVETAAANGYAVVERRARSTLEQLG
jgi:hypothetical protein